MTAEATAAPTPGPGAAFKDEGNVHFKAQEFLKAGRCLRGPLAAHAVRAGREGWCTHPAGGIVFLCVGDSLAAASRGRSATRMSDPTAKFRR